MAILPLSLLIAVKTESVDVKTHAPSLEELLSQELHHHNLKEIGKAEPRD